MTLPKKVKVGGIEFEIHYRTFEGLDCSAVCSFDKATITINLDLCEAKREEALIHEIFEIINEAHEMKLPHSKIMTLGTSMHQILIDNPRIFEGGLQ